MLQPDQELEAERPRPRRLLVGLALLSVLLAWVPGLGLALAALALVPAIRRRAGWAISFALLGLITGALYTGLTLFFLPEGMGEEEAAAWERFDDLFDPPGAPAPPQSPPGAP